MKKDSTNGNANKDVFKPEITINIPVKASIEKIQEVFTVLGFDAPLPPLEQINQINLQISIDTEGNDE